MTEEQGLDARQVGELKRTLLHMRNYYANRVDVQVTNIPWVSEAAVRDAYDHALTLIAELQEVNARVTNYAGTKHRNWEDMTE